MALLAWSRNNLRLGSHVICDLCLHCSTFVCLIAILCPSTSAAVEEMKSGSVEELLTSSWLDSVDDSHRKSLLGHLISTAKARRLVRKPVQGAESFQLPSQIPECPPDGAGVGTWTTHIEQHHHRRHNFWAEDADFCNTLGLWTNGCGVMCPLRAAVIGTTVDLRPGQFVLDVGSGCGHFALWYHDWFGAKTLGVDFVESAVAHARKHVASSVPAKFCWLNIATHLSWVPSRIADLVSAVSVIHYLRTDRMRFEFGEEPMPGAGKQNVTRTSCWKLHQTEMTQCSVARELFRVVRVGGHVWIAHNGSYKRKWDPRRVWGPRYWHCCFAHELRRGEAHLIVVQEDEIFFMSKTWDPTYSVVLRRDL